MIEAVLDESIYIRALAAECSTPDEREVNERAEWVATAIQMHHGWILTREIARRYFTQYHHANRCRSIGALKLLKSFVELYSDSSRRLFIEDDDLPEVPGDFDPQDVPMVRAAAARNGCYLIAWDEPLREDLARQRIPENHGFTFLTLDDAEELLVGDDLDL